MARPIKTTPPTTYDSLAAAAGALGCDKYALGYLKQAGCAGFRSSRVHLLEVEHAVRTNAFKSGYLGRSTIMRILCGFLEWRQRVGLPPYYPKAESSPRT